MAIAGLSEVGRDKIWRILIEKSSLNVQAGIKQINGISILNIKNLD